jgi:hypothetical protein
VIGSEQRYAAKERHETWKIVLIIAAAFVAALLLGGVGAIITQDNQQAGRTEALAQTTATISARTQAIVQGHDKELSRIAGIATSIHNQQVSDDADRATLAKEVAEVGTYATNLANEVTANHNSAVGNDTTMCAALNRITTALGIVTACTVQG